MAETFKATVRKDGSVNATGLKVPPEVLTALGGGKKPVVKVTLNGNYSYTVTVGSMDGDSMLPLSAERRDAAGLKPGEEVEVMLELNTEPRTVEVPDDLAVALEGKPGARAAFDASAYSARKEYVRQVNEAKAQETRTRRIAKIVEKLGDG